MKNKKIILLLPLFLLSSLTSCKKESVLPPGEELPSYNFEEGLGFYKKVSQLTRFKSAKFIIQSGKKPPFLEKYLLTFDMPLDWNDKSLGTFPLRVEVGYVSDDAPTVYQCNGYFLNDLYGDAYLQMDDRHEIARMYNANFVNFEYRFFYESAPKELDNEKTDYWKYLTSRNAAYDFHYVIQHLSTILTGKRIFTGASKGGYTTNSQANCFPDDCDAYVSYVAPLCDGVNDRSFFKNIYETIGDLYYSKEQAKEYRDMLLEWQIEMLKGRDYLAPKYYQDVLRSGVKLTTYATQDRIYDASILDTITGVWQYYLNFSNVKKVLDMPKEDDPTTSKDERKEFLDASLAFMKSVGDADAWGCDTPFQAYYYQSITEMGNYYLDFSYIRNELERLDLPSSLLTIKEDEDEMLWQKMLFNEEQINEFKYDSSYRNEMINWSKTTTSNVIMINGGLDPWRGVRIPDVDNEHIHVFDVLNHNHDASISNMSFAMQNEVKALLNSFLGK